MKKTTVGLPIAIAALLGWLATAVPATCVAGDFSVAPIRMFLGADRMAGTVTIRNSGKTPLHFEILPKEWSQDADGNDVYLDTEDILIFPRLMTLKGGEDRDLRIGMKIPAGSTEKTYRVFINELPPVEAPNSTSQSGANVGFLINFALPVFYAPREPVAAIEITNLSLEHGQISVRLANTGSVFQFVQEMMIVGLDASGAEIHREPVADRYLLAGSVKSYVANISPDVCKALTTVAFSVRTDKSSANAKTDVDLNACASANPEISPSDSPR